MAVQSATGKPDWLVEHESTLMGQPVLYSYDKIGDILEIFFQQHQGGIGVELADNIVLRYQLESGQPLSLIFTSFSRLVQPTAYGPRSFQLTALDDLPEEMQRTVLTILQSPPVNHFLKLSGLLLAPDDTLLPITSLEQPTEASLDKILA
jgi:hypothetical protein